MLKLRVKTYDGRTEKIKVSRNKEGGNIDYPFMWIIEAVNDKGIKCEDVKMIDVLKADGEELILEFGLFCFVKVFRFKKDVDVKVFRSGSFVPNKVIGLPINKLKGCKFTTGTYVDGFENIMKKAPHIDFEFS